MTNDEIMAVLERVRTWPAERQEDLARIAVQLEQQDARRYALSDAQIEEVRRIRRAVRGGAIASDDEIARLWKQCGL